MRKEAEEVLDHVILGPSRAILNPTPAMLGHSVVILIPRSGKRISLGALRVGSAQDLLFYLIFNSSTSKVSVELGGIAPG
jgi:hypothetical protein